MVRGVCVATDARAIVCVQLSSAPIGGEKSAGECINVNLENDLENDGWGANREPPASTEMKTGSGGNVGQYKPADTLVRLSSWRGEVAGRLETGDKDIVLTEEPHVNLMYIVGDTRSRAEIFEQMTLLFALEDGVSTVALDEVALFVRFYDSATTKGAEVAGYIEEQLPPEAGKRCSKRAKHMFIDVDTRHLFCQQRVGHKEAFNIGGWTVTIGVSWRLSRANLHRRFKKIMFRPLLDVKRLCVQLEESVQCALVQEQYVYEDTPKHNHALDALNILSELRPEQVAVCSPELFKVFQNDEQDMFHRMQRHSEVFGLYVIILSKISSDSIFDEVSLYSAVLSRLANTLNVSVLNGFMLTLINALTRRGRDASLADVSSIVSAMATVALTLLSALEYENRPELVAVPFKVVFKQFTRNSRNLHVAWVGVTRLYPACLAAVEPGEIARDLGLLIDRTTKFIKESNGENVDFFLACVAHLFQSYDERDEVAWAKNVQPSSEHWVRLHILKPAAFMAEIALRIYYDQPDCGDSFDELVSGIWAMIYGMRAEKTVYRLDTSLMTHAWAIQHTWGLVEELVRRTYKRDFPVHDNTLELVHGFACTESEKNGESLLERHLFNEPSKRRATIITEISRTFFVHLFTVEEVKPCRGVAGMTQRVCSQLIRVVLDVGLALDFKEEEMWKSLLGLLFVAITTWPGTSTSLWGLQVVANLLSKYNDLVLAKPIAAVPDSTFEEGPWFAVYATRGLVRIGASPEANDQAIDVVAACLHALFKVARDTTWIELKLAILKYARTWKETESLDRFVLRVENRFCKSTYGHDLFTLRTLATSLQDHPKSSSLYFEIVELLVGEGGGTVSSPWLIPSRALSKRREVKLNYGTTEEEMTPEATLLTVALELQRSGLMVLRKYKPDESVIFANIICLQLQVQLLLCSALDDVGKDIVVRDLEDTVVRPLIDTYEKDQDEFWFRLAATCIALVEDALQESLSEIWTLLCGIESVLHSLIRNRSALSIYGINARRYAAFDPSNGTWTILSPDPLLSCEAIGEIVDTTGARIHWNSARDNIECVYPSQEFKFDVGGGCLFISPTHCLDNGNIGVYVYEKNKQALRLELQQDQRPEYAYRSIDRSGVGTFLLPVAGSQVCAVRLSLVRACQDKLLLVIRQLRACLEHEVWLPRYDDDEDAKRSRSILHSMIGNELLDCFSRRVSGEGAIGYHTAKELSGGDGTLGKVCESLLQLAHVAVKSLSANQNMTRLVEEIAKFMK